MNIRTKFFSIFAAIAGLATPALAQVPGNPFAAFGLDFYGFLLPWLFSFAIVYGLLFKLNLFGEVNKKIAGALAFVVAFFVTGVGGAQLAGFFTTIFGGASMFLAGILVIMLFAAMLGVDTKMHNYAALAVVIIIGAFLFLGSSSGFISVSVIGPNVISAIFWLVIIIVAIWFVMKEDKDGHGAAAGGKQT